jgi:hypothetical protein
MDLKINIDTRELEAKTLREAKRLAYGTVQGLNKTATQVQTAERVNLDRKFQIRKAGFLYRLVKVAFASVLKDKAVAEVYIDNTKQRVLLGLFEDGGVRDPAVGQNVAVPITGEAARPSFAQLVQDQFTFTRMRLKARAPKKGTQTIYEGKSGTFLIPGIGVFLRAAGAKATELIYSFRKPMRLDKRLGFTDTAQKVFSENFEKNFRDSYNSKKE